MSEVAVFNDNTYPYKEDFRGRVIEIPAKGHVKMEKDEANIFLGTMNQPVLDADGNHTPMGYKMLRVIKGEIPVEQVVEIRCNACGLTFMRQDELDKHILSTHMHELEDKEEAIEAIKPKTRPKPKTARKKIDIDL